MVSASTVEVTLAAYTNCWPVCCALGGGAEAVRLASRVGLTSAQVIDLDDPATANAVRADLAIFVSRPGPARIDEYQHMPDLLGALKAELNRELGAGRFVLAGSTSSDAVPDVARYLAGRVHLLSVLRLSHGEIGGVVEDPATGRPLRCRPLGLVAFRLRRPCCPRRRSQSPVSPFRREAKTAASADSVR